MSEDRRKEERRKSQVVVELERRCYARRLYTRRLADRRMAQRRDDLRDAAAGFSIMPSGQIVVEQDQ